MAQLSALAAVSPLLNQPPASGLVSFQISDAPAPADLVQHLGRHGIWIRDLADPSCLRACTHICTSDEEIDHLVGTSTISRDYIDTILTRYIVPKIQPKNNANPNPSTSGRCRITADHGDVPQRSSRRSSNQNRTSTTQRPSVSAHGRSAISAAWIPQSLPSAFSASSRSSKCTFSVPRI